MAREFREIDEAIEYAVEQYAIFADNIEENERLKISIIQNRGLDLRYEYDPECIEAIERAMDKSPELSEEIIVYRAGKMKDKFRPYLSASFCKSVAKDKFANGKETNTHKIILRKGSKIIPLCVINTDHRDPEAKLIIDVSCLKRRLGYYEYISKETMFLSECYKTFTKVKKRQVNYSEWEKDVIEKYRHASRTQIYDDYKYCQIQINMDKIERKLDLIAFVGYIGTFFLMFATLINDTFSDSANLGIVLDEYVLAFEIVMILMLFIYSVVNFMDGFRKTGVAFYSEMIEILQKFMHNQVK